MMSAGTVSWHGLTLSRAVRLAGRRVVRAAVTRSWPGIHGVEKSDLGFRGRLMPYTGEISAVSMADLDALIASWEDQVQAGAFSFSEAGSYEYVELTEFQIVSRHIGEGGIRVARIAALFTQLRPSSEEEGEW